MIARNFSHHESQVAAAYPLFQCKERIFGRRRFDMYQAVTQIMRQSVQVGPPGEPNRRAILHPQHHTAILAFCQRFALGRLSLHLQSIARQRQCQSRPTRTVTSGKNFIVQRRRKSGAPAYAAPLAGRKHGQGWIVTPFRKGGMEHDRATHMFPLCSISE